MRVVLALFLGLASFTAQAAVIGSCDGLDSIGNLIGQPKTYANGAIKVAYVSTEEPAAHPDHVLIFVAGEEMSLDCFAVSASDDRGGFGSVGFDKIKSSYNSTRGLLLEIPVRVWAGADGKYTDENVKVRINRSVQPPLVTIE